MPKTEEILSGLQGIVNNYSSVAIVWHVVLYALIVALLARWLPTNKFFVLLMCLPVISVAVMAFNSFVAYRFSASVQWIRLSDSDTYLCNFRTLLRHFRSSEAWGLPRHIPRFREYLVAGKVFFSAEGVESDSINFTCC